MRSSMRYQRDCCLFLAAIWISLPAYAICQVKDDAGNTIQIDSPAKRVISLSPGLTETLFAIDAGKQVVGVMSGSDYPPAAKRLPVVGSYTGLDLERLYSLQPDLIVTWGSAFSRQLTSLKKQGISIYISQPKQLEDVAKTMKNLGCLTGNVVKAEQIAKDFSAELNTLRKQYANQPIVTVFYQIGPYSLMTINKDSWINEALVLCGARNIFADALTISPQVNWEAVLTRNPQVVMNGEESDAWKLSWQRFPNLPAVKNHHLFTVTPDLIHRPGPRLIQGVSEICFSIQQARKIKSH